MITRRTLISSALAVPLLPMAAKFAGASERLVNEAIDAGETEIILAGGTGGYGEMVRKHFLDPFSEETGINIVEDGGFYGEKLAKLKAMAEVGSFEWDMVTLSADHLVEQNAQHLQDLGSCGQIPNVATNGVAGSCLQYGVLFDIGGGVMAYNSDEFQGAGRQPSSWADFWDVDTFPGPRALPDIGTPWWPMIAALTADGVNASDLFPLDFDHAFAKLDEIKPHVSVWWRSGDQSQQIWRSGEVVMAQMYAGRAMGLRNEGMPVGVSWNGVPLDAAAWCVLKEARSPRASLALLNYMYTRPEAHAAFAAESGGVTAMKDAFDLLEPSAQEVAATNPDNWDQIVQIDRGWLGQNHDAILEQWTTWVAS
ncbi:MAG: extracellular solute-binding protein [Alphaproteobacteria bacterium]